MRLLFIIFALCFLSPFNASSHDVSIQNAPLSEAFHSDTFIKNWAGLAVTDTMSFDFHNHEAALSKAQAYFTQEGWDSFKKALDTSRVVEMVITNKMVASMALRAAPTIITTKDIEGRHIWHVHVPVIITYHSGDKQRSNKLDITAVISRSDEPQNGDGIGITQYVAMNIKD